MTTDELQQILTAYAERAVTAIIPRPEIRIEVLSGEEEGDPWLSADVDFLHQGGERCERAATRAFNTMKKLVEADERMKYEGMGEGDDVIGLSVVVESK